MTVLFMIYEALKKIPWWLLVIPACLITVYCYGEHRQQAAIDAENLQRQNAELKKELGLAQFSAEKMQANNLALSQKLNALSSALKKVQENDEPSKDWSSVSVPVGILGVLGEALPLGETATTKPAANE